MPESGAPDISELAVNIVTTVCLVLTLLLVGYVAYRLISSSPRGRLQYLRRFRYGQFAIIYFIAIPMGVLAYYAAGNSIIGSILLAIGASVELVVFKFDNASFSVLMDANVYYCVVMVILYVAIACNAVMFTFSVAGRFLINRVRLFIGRSSVKPLYVVVGEGRNNICILRSVGKDAHAVLLGDPDSDQTDEIYLSGKSLMRINEDSDLASILAKLGRGSKKMMVIVNTGNDQKNLIYLERICAFIGNAEKKGEALGDMRFSAYTFGDPSCASAFLRYEERTKGMIRYIGKYRMTAVDFIDKYPITRFMTDEIDTEVAAVKPEVDVNVAYIGFGKSNLQLFLTSVENDQLMTVADGKYAMKPVSYWIFDKKDSSGEKNLNHNYHRYFNAMTGYTFVSKDDYFELPPFPSDIEPVEDHFFKEDINSRAFYIDLYSKLRPKPGRRAYNYVVIAFGSDMENLDLAEKISAKLREWDIDGFTYVFVKIRDGEFARSVVEADTGYSGAFRVFGKEDEVVYNVDKITRERTELMAMRRHVRYSEEGADAGMTEEDIVRKAKEKWYGKWVQVQRESNAYACLSLRMKLNLLGYDYVPAETDCPDRTEEFNKRYFAGDEPEYCNGSRRTIDYGDCVFKEDTIRARYAMQEHQRWNAYMICNGYIPATKYEAVHSDKTELMRRRRHGNLTTFEGLKEYREYAAKCRGTTPAAEDVIKYDYQLMDYASDLLSCCGYKITDKSVTDALFR